MEIQILWDMRNVPIVLFYTRVQKTLIKNVAFELLLKGRWQALQQH